MAEFGRLDEEEEEEDEAMMGREGQVTSDAVGGEVVGQVDVDGGKEMRECEDRESCGST